MNHRINVFFLTAGLALLITACHDGQDNEQQNLNFVENGAPVADLDSYLASFSDQAIPDTPSYCSCIERTCTPSDGPLAGQNITFPATGVRHALGIWCFVDPECGSPLRGDNTSCAEAAFAFNHTKMEGNPIGIWSWYPSVLATQSNSNDEISNLESDPGSSTCGTASNCASLCNQWNGCYFNSQGCQGEPCSVNSCCCCTSIIN